MTVIGFLLIIVVGAICGAIAEAIVGWSPGGFFAAAVVGILGAVLGGWAAPKIGLPSLFAVRIEGYSIEIVWSILGAIALLLILSAFRRSSYHRRSLA
jgi:uncharacterized membrane protein YeaQ/YmgE (transglycosylase-associated protein family)